MSLLEELERSPGPQRQQGTIAGVVPAIITDNQDSEGLGRVKVRLPWLSENNETDWIKVATFMAGDGRGGFFLPENGDEVLVAFEQGNMNFPYVIGAVWNSEHPPPESNSDGNNTIRKITSRSGHEIVFCDDSEGSNEKIEIHTNGGHRIVLDDSSGSEKIEIEDSSGSNSISIDSAQNSIAIESGTNLEIKSQNITIEATANLEVKASGNLKLEGAVVNIN